MQNFYYIFFLGQIAFSFSVTKFSWKPYDIWCRQLLIERRNNKMKFTSNSRSRIALFGFQFFLPFYSQSLIRIGSYNRNRHTARFTYIGIKWIGHFLVKIIRTDRTGIFVCNISSDNCHLERSSNSNSFSNICSTWTIVKSVDKHFNIIISIGNQIFFLLNEIFWRKIRTKMAVG